MQLSEYPPISVYFPPINYALTFWPFHRTKRKFNEIQDPLENVIEHYNQTKKKAKPSDSSSSSSGEDSDDESDEAADLKQVCSLTH